MKSTQQNLLCNGLLWLGYHEIPNKSTRYRVFQPPEGGRLPSGKPILTFVGRLGALRRGVAISSSFAVSDTFRLQILDAKPPLPQGL